MKNIFLVAVALVFGTVAYGQVAGAPTASTPVANLSPDPTANVGQSVQNGNHQKVRIRQAGTEQSVYTEQDNGNGAGLNLAYVRQTGAVSGASGYANRAETRQSGTENQSTTLQEGDLNNAVTRQGQNNANSSGNKAKIRQGVADQAESNYAAIEQDGHNNLASTKQTWDNNDAWTIQDGNSNGSMVTQNGAPEDSDGHSAKNFQFGNHNESTINQLGNGARNVATTTQTGDHNQAKQMQTNTAGAGGPENRAGIEQGWVLGPDVPLADQLANVDAPSLDPSVSGYPVGTPSEGAKAKQTQAGKGLEADIVQYGGSVGASNYAEQDQWGRNHDAAIFQSHTGGASNYAKQFQEGRRNEAGLYQEGSGHKALQDQQGRHNYALSTQVGEHNLLNIHQRGNDNAATSMQNGIDNVALIVQRDGQSFIAEQMGNGNQIDALQLGPNGNFDYDGIDCGFEDPMNLDMDFSIPDLEIGNICQDC